jgi:hypothetical protein
MVTRLAETLSLDSGPESIPVYQKPIPGVAFGDNPLDKFACASGQVAWNPLRNITSAPECQRSLLSRKTFD